MRLWPFGGEREQRSMERPGEIASAASWDEWASFLGVAGGGRVDLPRVTVETALEVPAVFDAVNFLSRMMATLPLHAYRSAAGEAKRVDGELQMLLNEAPNDEWTSADWRRYMWQGVFTGGRGVSWIERRGVRPVAIWPMDPNQTTVGRRGGRRYYRIGANEYPAADVIDVTFALRPDQLAAYGPIHVGRKSIGLAIAMNDFAAGFFAGGGIPPMALEGPLPQGPDAFKRATEQIQRAIELARKAGRAFFGMPPGHSLKPVGIDPDKGQMTEARLFQIQEIARLYGLPPVFLQDLSKGTFSNTEQQDLQLVKHLVVHWAVIFEQQLNLKLFGQRRRAREIKHNLEGLQRGDFKSRVEGIARQIQTAQITPNEARALEDRPPLPDGDTLYIQGATVPLGSQPVEPAPVEPATEDTKDLADAETQAA
ncbi:HK97 family phage portal protein [Sphingomonas jinjuensis]|uniref:HK97 family phage portal protein n=1 Tax=Sphingomonas jinjuensis TaxID=535907 RepID=A0A840F8N4_9SPHN|nr:phage portal protein [Sphingomonas jinjuensis]MBB4152911.1 HK97 family phage portal protein [Sphingomonas jinjuensis]